MCNSIQLLANECIIKSQAAYGRAPQLLILFGAPNALSIGVHEVLSK